MGLTVDLRFQPKRTGTLTAIEKCFHSPNIFERPVLGGKGGLSWVLSGNGCWDAELRNIRRLRSTQQGPPQAREGETTTQMP